jgi:hypothetical protein
MVKNYWMILILCLVFGLPFMAITDLFPLHRFGMFAQKSSLKLNSETFEIEIKLKDKNWEKLKTGNSYMDESYLPLLAKKCILNVINKSEFGKKIHISLKEKPDSIRISQMNENNSQQTLSIYPN